MGTKLCIDPGRDLIADSAVHPEDLPFASRCNMGICKSVVDRSLCLWHHRAYSVCIVAECYCKIEGNGGDLFEGF